MTSDPQRVRQYLQNPPHEPLRPGLGGRLSAVLPQKAIPQMRLLATRAIAPLQHRKTRPPYPTPFRVQLGCGFSALPGWVNIDLLGPRADLYWDLRRGIPYPDNSVDVIFHEHVLEHLPYRIGLPLTIECLRVLKPGGVLRVVVPNPNMVIDDYLAGDPRLVEHYPTPMMAVTDLFSGYGHVAMYDADTLIALILAAGFSEAEERQFGESAIDPVPDSEGRRDEGSLYVEAVKG
jgi:predicted SAM-dependent methyltransferase